MGNHTATRARGRSSASGGSGASSMTALHERAARLRREGGLAREVTPAEAGKYGERLVGQHPGEFKSSHEEISSLFQQPTAAGLVHAFGEPQLGAVLSTLSGEHLRGIATEQGVSRGGSRADLVSRITAHVTEGRYSADFGSHSTTGTARHEVTTARTSASGPTPRERAAESRATAAERTVAQHERTIATLQQRLAAVTAERDALKARAQGERATTRTTTRTTSGGGTRGSQHATFTNLVPVGPIDRSRLTPMHSDPYALVEGYGRRQSEGVLHNMTMEELRRGAGIVAQRNPGTAPASRSKRADLVEYIMAHLPAEPA